MLYAAVLIIVAYIDCHIIILNDVCLKAEVLLVGSLRVAEVLPQPRLDALMPCMGHASASYLLPRLRSYGLGLSTVYTRLPY